MGSDLLLTSKERARLEKVRKMLRNNENPYSETKGMGAVNDPPSPKVIKAKSSRERKRIAQRWKDPTSPSLRGGTKGIVSYRTDPTSTFDPRCPVCEEILQYTTSVLGKMVVGRVNRPGFTEILMHPKKGLVPVDYYRSPAPKLATVRVCQSCKDHLSEILEDPIERHQPVYGEGSAMGFGDGFAGTEVDGTSYEYFFHRKQGKRKGE